MDLPKAVIFDMDGLMFDTERLGMDAWLYTGRKMKLDITEEIALKTIGISWDVTKQTCFNEFREFDFDNARKIWQDYVNHCIEEQGIPIKHGLIELLSFLDKAKIKKAVATGSYFNDAMFYINKAGMSDSFDAIITREMVTHGKPAPDIFIYTAKILNAAPEECIVLEDSINGIKAAYAAKMIPVMIPDLIPSNEEIDALLYAKLNSMAEVISLIKKRGIVKNV
jgi:HAD superfamily hydrolase (TIGR01509 family)